MKSTLKESKVKKMQKISTQIACCLLLTPIVSVTASAADKSAVQAADVPTVVQMPVADAPPLPEKVRARCFKTADSGRDGESKTCPVVQYEGVSYWPLSYDDNRYEIMIAGFDSNGRLKHRVKACNTRYIWKATVDNSKHTVTFFGQRQVNRNDATTADVPWNVLPTNTDLCRR